MTAPLYPVETIRYKTYLKNTIGGALRTVFSQHPDQILKTTKVGVDFPVTEADYPAVVVRFYEREIKNAGVSHYENLLIENLYNNVETWFDNFTGQRSAQDYKVKAGAYTATGILTATPTELMPWTPVYNFGQSNVGHGAHAKIVRAGNEDIVIRVGVASALANTVSFIGQVSITGATATLSIIYRDAANVESTLQSVTQTFGSAQTAWMNLRLQYDGALTLTLGNDDPFLNLTPTSSISATASAPQMASITVDNNRYWVGGSGNGTSAKIALFRTLKTNVLNERFYKFKHFLYNGDIEFAVYALSSYDRDLVSDSLVQILGMGDLLAWTQPLLNSIYDANPTTDPVSLDHMINLNTDTIQGFGETQQIAPWMPEDVMVYQTSYRIHVFGEFYSRVPTTGDLGLVERIETYPYMGQNGDPVPNPNDSGPDHVQGTADDIVDNTPWDGTPVVPAPPPIV